MQTSYSSVFTLQLSSPGFSCPEHRNYRTMYIRVLPKSILKNLQNLQRLKNILAKGGFETAISCVRNQYSTSASQWQRYQRRSLINWHQFMLQWFVWFPEFTESSVYLGKAPISCQCVTHWCVLVSSVLTWHIHHCLFVRMEGTTKVWSFVHNTRAGNVFTNMSLSRGSQFHDALGQSGKNTLLLVGKTIHSSPGFLWQWRPLPVHSSGPRTPPSVRGIWTGLVCLLILMESSSSMWLCFVLCFRFSEDLLGCRTRLPQLRWEGHVSPSVPKLYRKVPNELPWEVLRQGGSQWRYPFNTLSKFRFGRKRKFLELQSWWYRLVSI